MDKKVGEDRAMLEDRHPDRMMKDSAESIQRGGGEDPRRYEARILVDRVVRNHDMSGYNHNATSSQPANGGHENEMRMHQMDRKSAGMGTPNPDGTRS